MRFEWLITDSLKSLRQVVRSANAMKPAPHLGAMLGVGQYQYPKSSDLISIAPKVDETKSELNAARDMCASAFTALTLIELHRV